MVAGVVGVLLAIVTVAGLGIALTSTNTAQIVAAIFDGFAKSLTAAIPGK